MTQAGFPATVTDIRKEAEGVLSFALARTDGGPLPPWEPGAHVDLLLLRNLSRQYSICSDPADRTSLRIAVLREPRSRGGSETMHTIVMPGDTLPVQGIRNNFPLIAANDYVMIAGGIGITPILTMIHALERAGKKWSLLYGGRTRATMAFTGAMAQFGEKVKIRPEDEFGLLDLASTIGLWQPGKVVYCCGPEPLIKAVEALCAGWPDDSLQVERFRAKEQDMSAPDTAFDVELKRRNMVVHVPAGQSIADALDAVGVHIPRSCNEGTCGTCLTKLLDGEADHRDSFLRPKQRAEGKRILVCCSRAFSPRLVLDV